MDKIKYFGPKDINGNSKIDFKQILRGIVWSATLCIILLLISAVVLTYTNVSISLAGVLSNIIFYIGAISSGMLSSSKIKSNGWLHGLISGGVYACVIFFVTFLVNISEIKLNLLLLKLLASLFLGGVGGIVGVNVFSKKR